MIRKLPITVLLPVILYSVVAIFITYPLITQLSTNVIGIQFTDSFEYVRWGWWGKYALQNGLSPFYQSMFAYPDGFFSAVQWSQPLVYWPISILNIFTNPAAAFNLWILAELVLNGLTAYWFCLAVIEDDISLIAVLGALLGGLIFMGSQTTQGHLSVGHVNILSVYGLPPLAWALYRVAQGRGTRKHIIWGAVSILILLLGNDTSPVYLIFPLFLLFFLYIVLGSRLRRQALPWKMLRNGALILIAGGALSLPFYIPLALDASSSNRPAFYNLGEVLHYSTDLLAFATPSSETPWTRFTENPTNRWIIDVDGVEGAAYLGIAALLLAIAGILAYRRDSDKKPFLWLTVGLGSMILSLGPALKWAGYAVTYTAGDFTGTIPMPWALFQNLPVFSLARTPGRINFVTMLCLATLAALGLVAVARRIKLPVVRVAVTLIVAVVVVAESQEFFPFPTISAGLPPTFAQIAARDDIRAVLDVPLNSLTGTKEALFEQTAHLKPLIAGYVSRATPVNPDKLALLSGIAMGQANRTQDGQALDVDTARAVLKANGVDVLVYHWEFVDKKPVLEWANKAFKSLYEDDNTAIFEVPTAQNDVEASAIIYDGLGWSGKSPWFGADSGMVIYTSAIVDRQVSLNLTPLLATRSFKITVDGQYAGLWTVVPPTQRLDFWLRLVPGVHRVQFTFPEGCTPVPILPECITAPVQDSSQCLLQPGPVQASQEVCVSAGVNSLSLTDAGAMSFHEKVAQLGQGFSLKGYRLPKTIVALDPLPVETDWQATRVLDGDYHYFIHVLAPDGSVAGQYDSVPDNGNFPTSKWLANQQWNALASLTAPAKPGIYSVYVGWYRYPDLTRLTVEGNAPHAADGEVYLGDIEVK